MARKRVRDLAQPERLAPAWIEALATAVTEVARNIVVHAGSGEIRMGVIAEGKRHGIAVVALDQGSGIDDIERAMQDGYSTAQGLGLGLSSARRLVDTFEIFSKRGSGTTVVMRKWFPQRRPGAPRTPQPGPFAPNLGSTG
jgi:serine/threonine-protein kinase RsbT